MTSPEPETAASTDTELAARLRMAVTRTARRLRQEGDAHLTPSQLAALATVARQGPLTPSELAGAERIQRPTATRVAAKLEDRGLIERTADPDDRRSSLLAVSGEGAELLQRVRSRKDAYLAAHLDGLSPADRAALERAADVLERMLDQP